MRTRKYNKKYGKGKPKGTSLKKPSVFKTLKLKPSVLKSWKSNRKNKRPTARTIRYNNRNSKRFDHKYKHRYTNSGPAFGDLIYDEGDVFSPYEWANRTKKPKTPKSPSPKTTIGKIFKTISKTIFGK